MRMLKEYILPGKYGQEPVLPIVAKHLAEVGKTSEIVAILIGSANAEDGRAERFCDAGER